MRKVVISSAGGYDKLVIETSAEPTITDDQVLIDVAYAGVNYADCCVRWGVYESAKKFVGWPITPGFETSGVIKRVGAKVSKFKVGDQVIAYSFFNGYASQIAVNQDQLIALPNGFNLESGAAFPAVFMTAYHALFQQFILRPGSKILVHSAAGGVGTAIIQLGKIIGCKIVGVVGSSHKVDYLKKMGIDRVVDKSTEKNYWANLKNEFGDGFDAVFDANGHTTFRDSYKALRQTGKLVVYGSHSMLPNQGGRLNYFKAAWGLLNTPRINPLNLITDNKSVIGFNVSFLFSEKAVVNENIAGLSKFAQAGAVKPIATTVFKFDDVARAHQLIESGQSTGKIVLKM